ncbi:MULTISPECIES: hypothetical protein [unclassified Marinitoga]|uniref:hypothetical protein n=1 Tax=unclassified Marinitoga TaxID=2640159 RepID=UPI0009509451|nr:MULTISPECIES: hypothetical protein [unclassified Marinitoga]APT76369.1 hypothetical protein LN42_08265 [Marinitoga sp. 1137]NUU98047.1 hypothetical protein [Marinitoga sp. 1138]
MKKVFLFLAMTVLIFNVAFSAKTVFNMSVVFPTLRDLDGRMEGILSFKSPSEIKYGFASGFFVPFIKYNLFDLNGTFDFATSINTLEYKTEFSVIYTFGKREASMFIEQPITSDLEYSTKYGIRFFVEGLNGNVIISTTLKDIFVGFTY